MRVYIGTRTNCGWRLTSACWPHLRKSKNWSMESIPSRSDHRGCQQGRCERPRLPAADLRQTWYFQPRGVSPICGQRDGFGGDVGERVTGSLCGWLIVRVRWWSRTRPAAGIPGCCVGERCCSRFRHAHGEFVVDSGNHDSPIHPSSC